MKDIQTKHADCNCINESFFDEFDRFQTVEKEYRVKNISLFPSLATDI